MDNTTQNLLTEEQANALEAGTIEKEESLVEKPVQKDTLLTEEQANMVAQSSSGKEIFGGSKDINTNPDKFNFQLRIGEDNEKLRAINQSNWDQFGNMLMQGVVDGIIGQTIGGVGSVLELPVAIKSYLKDQPADFNNALIEFSNDLKNYSKDAFPIYRENPSKSFDVGDFAWAMEGFTSIFSTAGLLIPGLAAAKGTGKAVGYINKLLKTSKKTAEIADDVTRLGASAFVMRNAEGFMDASRVGIEMKQSLLNKWASPSEWNKALETQTVKDLKAQGVKITKDNVAAHIAAKASWRDYQLNSANILFDMIQIAPILGLSRLGRVKPKVNPTVSTKLVSPTVRRAKTLGSIVLRQSTEGIEEAVNFVASEEGTYLGNTLAGDSERSISERANQYLSDGHLWESAFWGTLGGIVFETGGRALTYKQRQEQEKREEQRLYNALEARNNFIKTTNAKLAALKQGTEYKDEVMTFDASTMSEEEREAAIKDIKHISGVNLGITSYYNNTVDTVYDQIKDQAFIDTLDQEGLIDKNNVQNSINSYIESVKQGEKIAKKAEVLANKAPNTLSNVEHLALRNKFGTALTYENYYKTRKNQTSNNISKLKNEEVYIKQAEKNSSVDDYIRIAALQELSKNLDITDDILDSEKVLLNYPEFKLKLKEQFAKEVKELSKTTEERREKGQRRPKLNSEEMQNIIAATASNILYENLEDKIIEDIPKYYNPSVINELSDNIKQAQAKEKEIAKNVAKEVLDNEYNVTEKDTEKTLTDKITSLKDFIKQSKNDEAINKLAKDKLVELQNAVKRKTSTKVTPKEEKEENTSFDDMFPDDETLKAEQEKQIKEENIVPVEEDYAQQMPLDLDSTEENNEEENPESSNIPQVTPTKDTKVLDESLNSKTKKDSVQPKKVVSKPKKEVETTYTINTKGETSIFLEGTTEFNDKQNHTIEEQHGLFELLKGEYKVGDTVNIQPDLNAEGSENAQTLMLKVLGKKNKHIGYINTIKGKTSYYNARLAKLVSEGKYKNSKGEYEAKAKKAERDSAAKELQGIKQEIEEIKAFRETVFQNRDSFALAPLSVKISGINSGSIINVEVLQSLKDSFGDNAILYRVDPNVPDLLKAENLTNVPNHKRQAYEDSYLNNADAVYTNGVFFALVDSPNNNKFPVPLQSSNLTEPYIDKLYEGLTTIATLMHEQGYKANDSVIKDIKDILDTITYIGAGNVEIYDNNFKLFNRNEDGDIEYVQVYFNKLKEGKQQFNLSKGKLVQGKFVKDFDVFNDRNKIEDIIKTFASNLIFNPNKAYVNKKGKFINPLSQNFDGTVADNPIVHDSYFDFLSDENILVTNVGTVKDSKNNIVSNFAVKGKSNLVLKLDLTQETKVTSKKSATTSNFENDNSITNTIMNKFTSFNQLQKELKLSNTFKELFNYADKVGIKITNNDNPISVAATSTKTKNISFNKELLSKAEVEGLSNNQLEEVLAHEIVHGFILNEIVDKKALNNDLLNFLTSLKPLVANAPQEVKSLLDYAFNNNPQEIVSIAYTNKAVKDWLNTQPSKQGKNNLLSDLYNLLKNFLGEIIPSSKLQELDNIISNNLSKEGEFERLVANPYTSEFTIGITKENFSDFSYRYKGKPVEIQSIEITEQNKILSITLKGIGQITNLKEITTNFEAENRLKSKGQQKSLFEDFLDDEGLLGFPDIKNIKAKESFTSKELIDSVSILTGYFNLISNKPEFAKLSKSELKEEFKNLLYSILNKDKYPAKEVMTKVIANYDLVWDNVERQLARQQKITFKEDQLEQEEISDFTLTKEFDDSAGALEKNVKDNVPDSVKESIRKTPVVLRINEEATIKKDRYVYDESNTLALPSFLDFDFVYPYFQDKLAGIKSAKDLINRLERLKNKIPTIDLLLNTIKADKNVLSAWVSHFDKQKVDFEKEAISKGKVIKNLTTITSSINSPSRLLTSTWITELKNKIETEQLSLPDLAKEIKAVNDSFKNYNKNKDKLVTGLSNAFELLGFTYKGLNIADVIEKEITDDYNIERFGTEENIISKLLVEPINYINKTLQTTNEFDNYKDVLNLSNTIESHLLIPLQNTFISVKGKRNYAITLPNFLSKFFKKVQDKTPEGRQELLDYLEVIAKVPSMKYSNWLSKMASRDAQGNLILNDAFFDNFNYIISDGLTNLKSIQGVAYQDFSEKDWDLNNILKFYKGYKKKFYQSSILIPADSSNIYYLNVPRFTYEASLQALDKIVAQEAAAMAQAKDLLFDVNENTGKIEKVKEDLDTSKLLLNYHYKENKAGDKVFIDENGNPTGNVFKFQVIPELNKLPIRQNGLLLTGYNTKENVEAVKEIIAKYAEEEIITPAINAFLPLRSQMYSLVFNEPYNKKNEEKWNRFVRDFALNELINNVEMLNFFYGTTAEYKSKADIGKRLKEVIAPGLAQSNINKGTFNVVTIKDIYVQSSFIPNLATLAAKSLVKYKSYTTKEKSFTLSNVVNNKPSSLLEKDIVNIIKDYKNINSTDAQGYITLNRFEEILINEGRYNEEIEDVIEKAKNGELIDIQILTKYLEPVKGFYYNRYYDEGLNMLTSKQIKYSTFPLIPAFTQNTDLDIVRNYLEKNNIDEAVFESTTKVGRKEAINLSDENGNIIEENLKNLVPETLDNAYWQRQLDVPDDIQDKEKLLGVQIGRIAFGNNVPQELFNTYTEILQVNLEESAQEALKSLGFDGNGNLTDINQVRTYIKDQVKQRKLPKAFEEALQPKGIANDNFKLPLFISALSKKFQSMFLSKFTNDVVKQKLPGFSAVQFSPAFTKQTVLSDDSVSKLTSNLDTNKNPNEALTIKEENGRIVAEVLVPPYDSNFIRNGKTVDINEIPESLREIFGYRIPSSKKNFGIVFKVVGFLPREMSSSIIVPAEIVTIMGSDFDVDKLNLFRKQIKSRFKKAQAIKKMKAFYNDAVRDGKVQAGVEINYDSISTLLDEQSAGLQLSDQDRALFNLYTYLDNKGQFDEFKSFDIEEYDFEKPAKDQSKAARKNGIVTLFQNIFTNPDYAAEVFKPSAMSNMLELKELSNSLQNIKEEDFNLFTYTGQKELRTRNLSGQSLTGIAANFNSFFYVAQKVGLQSKVPIEVVYNKSEINADYIRKNFIVNYENETSISISHKDLGNILNINNVLISDILGETLDSAVDTVKEPIHPSFNSNKYTFPLFAAGLMMGIDHKVMGMFINQPIIKEVSAKYFESQSNVLRNNVNYISQIRNIYEKKLFNLKYGNLPKSEYKELEVRWKESWNNAGEEEGILGYNRSKTVPLNLSKLKDSIKNQNQESETYLIHQLETLANFATYNKIAEELNLLILTSKTDNLSVGPTIATNQSLSTNISKLNKQIKGEEGLVDAMILRDSKDNNAIRSIYPKEFGINTKSNYSPLEDYFINAHKKALETSGQLFIQGTKYFNAKVVEFLGTIRMNLSIKNIDKINNLYISRIMSKTKSLRETDFNSLLGLTEGTESVAKRLYNIKSNPLYKDLAENETNILYHLNPDLTQDIDSIKFKNIPDPLLNDLVYDSFVELYNSEDKVLSDLAVDLFKYSFITNGLSFGLSSFSSLLPVQLYEDLGINKEVEDAHRKALVSEPILDEIDDDIILRNKWQDTSFITNVGSSTIDDSFKYGFISFKKPTKLSKRLLESKYLTYNDNLYLRVANKANSVNAYFMPIPKLGDKNLIDFYDNLNTPSRKIYENLPYSNPDEAYDLLERIGFDVTPVLENTTVDESRLSFEDTESLQNTRDKIVLLKEVFSKVGVNADIKLNENLSSNASVQKQGNKVIITLNPNKVFKDTVIHEFAHIYIDLLGENSAQVNFGIDQLKDTKLWKEVAEAYPELTELDLGKEVLVTAIGREGAKLFDSQEKQSRFQRFLSNIWNKIANILGLNNLNVAKKLAKDMLNFNLDKNLKGDISEGIRFSKDINYEKTTKIIEKRILDLEKQISRFKDNEFTEDTKKFIEDLTKLDKAKQLKEIVLHIKRRLAGVNHRLKDIQEDGEPSPENFNKLYNSFVVINSYKDILDTNIDGLIKETAEDEELKEAIQDLKSSVLPLVQLKVKAKELGEILLEKKVKETSTNPDVIAGVTEIFGVQQDENTIQYLLDALADTNNTFVALTVKSLSTALDKKNLKVKEEIRDFDKAYTEFLNEGFTFNDILEKDDAGNSLPSLLSEFNIIKYDIARIDLQRSVDELILKRDKNKKGSERYAYFDNQIRLTYAKWYKENGEFVPNYNSIIKERQATLTKEEFNKWKESNYKIDNRGIKYPLEKGELYQPKATIYKSKRYQQLKADTSAKGQAKRDFYNYYRELMSRLVENNNSTFIEKGYIPFIPVDTRSGLQIFKEDYLKLKKSKNYKEDNYLLNVDESGKVISGLVQPYIRQTFQFELEEIQEEDSDEVKKEKIEKNSELKKKHKRLIDNIDLDMAKVMPEFIKTSYDFNTRKSMEAQMLVSSEILKLQEIQTNPQYADKIATLLTGSRVPITTTAESSNISKHLSDYINMVFYGDFEKKENEKLMKAAQVLQNYTSLAQVGFNPFVGINNKLFGTMQNLIETSGGYFFDAKSYRKALSLYNNSGAIIGYFANRNKDTADSLPEAVIKHFDIYQSQLELAGKKGGPIQTALDKLKLVNNLAYGMHTMGEHSMQNVSLLAMMNSHRIVEGRAVTFADYVEQKLKKPKDGIDIDAIIEENKTIRKKAQEEFEKSPTVLESYELKDGYLSLKEGVNFNGDAFSEFRQRVIGVNQYMHGIYNKEDAGTIQKYALGRLALQMKKWMRPGWNRRFGTKFGKEFWNERRQAPDEGMYVSTFNFVKELLFSSKDLVLNYKIAWNSMSEYQRSNVKRTMAEMMFLAASYTLTVMATALAEDDDELKDSTAFNMLIYQSDRLSTEILTYFPVWGWFAEAQKLLKSPAASYGTLSNTFRFAQNTILYPFRTEEEREFRSGIRYGDDKAYSYLIRTLPLINKAERLYYLRQNNEFYSLL